MAEVIDSVLKGLITGCLIAVVIIYSLRPKIPYPKWMLMSYEHPWIFVIMIGVVFWLAAWDKVVGALSFIVVITLVLDFYMLGKRNVKTSYNNVEVPMVSTTISPSSLVYDDFDDLSFSLFQENDDFQPGEPSPF